jgi:copper transport protein
MPSSRDDRGAAASTSGGESYILSFVQKRAAIARVGSAAQRAVPLGVAALVVVLTVGVLGPTQTARAHSFLVATSPAQGERLASPPQVIVLEFSEDVDPSSVVLGLRAAAGRSVETVDPHVAGGGLEVRMPVGDRLGDGIYVAAWEALSAVDGHGTSGEFAFAVGDAGGEIPQRVTSSETSRLGVVASWVFFVGLAVAAGALVLRAAGSRDVPGTMTVQAGLVLTIAGALASLTVAGSERLLLLFCIEALAVALLAVALRWPVAAPLVAVAVAAGMWAGQSHGTAQHGAVGWFVDVVHLAAGSAWAGSLVLVVWVGWRLRRAGESWIPLVRSYARVAIGLAAALGVAGGIAAVELLPTWRAVWETGYGQLVVTKAALFAAAVMLAVVGRWGLRRRRADRLRGSMTVEGTFLVAALVVAALLVNGAPPEPTSAAEQLLGPTPLAQPLVRDAGLAGQLNVDVAADGDRLDVKVFTPSGPVRGTTALIHAQAPDGSSSDLVPRPCGPGCFTQPFHLAQGISLVHVTVTAPDWTPGSYEARLVWPPGRPATDLLAETVDRMRDVPELTMTETVSSGPDAVATGTFTIDGARLIAAEPYAAANLDEVRLLPGPPRELMLYLPGSQIYGTLELDDAGRIARARLVTRGHEITREFSYPDR